MLKAEPTERFSSRVQNYVRYRPSYPPQVIDVLREECGLQPESVVADIASGTGIFTRLLLENGSRVLGVEPNENMRRAGEEYLAAYPNFISVAGTAEATTLADNSLDLITCAQAAHWFDRDKALREFCRILKPEGYVVLIWNNRHARGTGFGEEYERIVVKYGTDYSEIQRLGRSIDGRNFFPQSWCETRSLPNYQDFDYEALEGRLLSSSYAPQPSDPACAQMLEELRRVFDERQRDGRVRMNYSTDMYFARIS